MFLEGLLLPPHPKTTVRVSDAENLFVCFIDLVHGSAGLGETVTVLEAPTLVMGRIQSCYLVFIRFCLLFQRVGEGMSWFWRLRVGRQQKPQNILVCETTSQP